MESNLVVEDEFRYGKNIVNLSKSSADSVLSSKEKSTLSKNISTSKNFIQNESNAEKYDLGTKAKFFASLMDPVIISSLNYLSALLSAELYNCVTLHK